MNPKIIITSKNPEELQVVDGHLVEGNKKLLQLNTYQSFKPIPGIYSILCGGILDRVELLFGSNEMSKHAFNILEAHVRQRKENVRLEKEKMFEARKAETMDIKFKLFQNVLKTRYANDLNLKGLKEVQKQPKSLWLLFQQNNEGIKWMDGQPEDELEYAFQLLSEHLEKIQILKIFKDLQGVNPFSPPEALWTQATETYRMLKSQGIETHY